jgi:tRNA(Ile)-lysidine synthase
MPTQNVPPASPDEPVTGAGFQALAAPLIGSARFAVAVSGGADSVALMCLAADWCRSVGRGLPLAITVDHGLREGSAREASQVERWAQDLGLVHLTLAWEGRTHQGNLQAEARRARYALLADALSRHDVSLLATGHTRDDQAETLLIRLARGSGLAGLSGMSPRAPYPGRRLHDMSLVRPLLDIPHSRLVATLRARGQPWVEDPSNANPKFLRARIRATLPSLAGLGLTADRLAATAGHLARANAAIEGVVAELAARVLQTDPCGYVLMETRDLRAAPDEAVLRLVARVLKTVSGEAYAPRFDRLAALADWLRAPPAGSGRTLGGCRLACRADGSVLVAREEDAMRRAGHVLRLRPGGSGVWDGRFSVAIPAGAPDTEYEVKALGPEGVRALDDKAVLPRHEPRRVAATCPSVWRSGTLLAAPTLGHDVGIGARAAFLGA